MIKATPSILQALEGKKDLDKVGKGENFCMPCDRYFMNTADLEKHERSKPHKKRLKYLAEPQYSHAEAEMAGGLGSYVAPNAPSYPIQLGLMTTRHKDEVKDLETQLISASVMQ